MDPLPPGYDPGRAARRARAFLAELERAHQPSYDLMLRHYQEARSALVADIERITRGVPDASKLPLRQDALLRALDARIAQYLRVVQAENARNAATAAQAGVEAGIQQMQHLGIAQGVDVSQGAVGALQGVLQDPQANPLTHLIPAARQRAASLLGQAVTLGWGPKRVAREMAATADLTRSRAELIARTEMIRAYREANRAQWAAHPDIVSGWIWMCHPSVRTCPICYSQHGTMHPISESLTSHPNCRCTMLAVPLAPPGVDGSEMTNAILESVQPGEDLLRALPVSDQQKILGAARWEKWHNGMPLNDMVTDYFHPIYGQQRRLTPLRNLPGAPPVQIHVPRTGRPTAPPAAPEPVAPPGGPMVLEPGYKPGARIDASVEDVNDVTNHALSVIDRLGIKPPPGFAQPKLRWGGKGTYVGDRENTRAHYRVALQAIEQNAHQMGKDLRLAEDLDVNVEEALRTVRAGYANTVIHEYGHHIDFTQQNVRSRDVFDAAGVNPNTILRTKTDLLRAMRETDVVRGLSQGYDRFGQKITDEYRDYLTSDSELIARAFQQWAARKVRDGAMVRYVSRHAAQWSYGSEFDAVEKALVKWLEASGWMT